MASGVTLTDVFPDRLVEALGMAAEPTVFHQHDLPWRLRRLRETQGSHDEHAQQAVITVVES